MTLPSSGIITAAMINIELGRAQNAPFNLNDAAVRALAEKPSGPISFNDLRGKSSEIVIDAPLGNGLNLCSAIFNNYQAGLWSSNKKKRLRVTGERNSLRIDTQYGGEFTLEITPSGILSGGTVVEGLAIDTGVTSIVPVINNGIIRGRGGNGGAGGQGGAGNYSVYTREPVNGQHFSKGSFHYGQERYYERSGGGDYREWSRWIIVWNGWRMHNSSSWLPPSPFYPGDGWAYHKIGTYNIPREMGYQGTYEASGIVRDRTDWYGTTGGGGGAGGIGIGYGIARTNGQDGQWGGTNAGRGGRGGDGGDWGQPGGAGATGASGNVGAGSGGAAGGDSFSIWGVQRISLTGSGRLIGKTIPN